MLTEGVSVVLSFLIGTLVVFIINLFLTLIVFAANATKQQINIFYIINIFIALAMITWNILAIVSL